MDDTENSVIHLNLFVFFVTLVDNCFFKDDVIVTCPRLLFRPLPLQDIRQPEHPLPR